MGEEKEGSLFIWRVKRGINGNGEARKNFSPPRANTGFCLGGEGRRIGKKYAREACKYFSDEALIVGLRNLIEVNFNDQGGLKINIIVF